MKSRATKGFWECYNNLRPEIRKTADKNFDLFKKNLHHPSLKFKRIGELYSVRIGLHHRALGLEKEGFLYWCGYFPGMSKLARCKE